MRAYPAVVAFALLGATLSPLARSPYDDAFPLSTYPMFAVQRPTKLAITYAIATGGSRHAIPPAIVGSSEPLQAMAILETATRHAPAAQALCELIASRIAGDPDYADATLVRIVTGTHDAVDYLVHHQIGPEVDRVTCLVRR